MEWIDNIAIGDFFDQKAGEMPDHKILVTSDSSDYTFRELQQISDRLARRLVDWGIRKGDHVAVWAHNIPEWEFLFLGLGKIGAVMLPLNPNIRTHDLQYDLKTADADYLIMVDSSNGDDFVQILRDAISDLEVLSPGCVQSKQLPRLKGIMTIGEQPTPGFAFFRELLEGTPHLGEADYRLLRKQVLASDPFIIKFTCGLTGYGRGTMLTHFGLINNAIPVAHKQNLGPEDIICLTVPFHYIFGFWVGIVVSFCTHSPLVIMPRYNAGEILRLIQEKRCTALYGVPTMFADLFGNKSFAEFDLSSLRTGIMSGAHCPPALVQKTFEEMPIPELTVCYGMTEIGILTHTDCASPRDKVLHTVGTPVDGMELKIVDPATGKDLPEDVQGEICVRSPVIMKGYYRMPMETAELLDNEGWFHTGDLGTRDRDGYYRITGRNRNMIIRGGENIYPLEVERHLLSFPAVTETRVVGVPSRRLGEEVYAFVKTTGETYTAQAVRDYFRSRYPRHYIPRWVKRIEAFPGEETGCIDRNRLRDI
ncbi:MAG TPA: AMP-binding protein, partial [Thermodesulfobacteriota bacterium]|nr:AMP-binding protein [Thermodesulfobacteriota bacterium]